MSEQQTLLRQISDLGELVEMLSAEIRRGRCTIRSQQKMIESMRNALHANGIPVGPTTMSFSLCVAKDDEETCPLALLPINGCGLPFDGCCAAIDPLNPNKKCAQLVCGHRFNAVWVVYYFVRNNTARCPLCRKGDRRFRFGADTVPACMRPQP